MGYQQNIVFWVSLGLLVVGFALQLIRRFRVLDIPDNQFASLARLLFFLGIVFIAGWYCYLVYAQYAVWRAAGPPASFLVPPHRSIAYVFWYHYIRFGLYYSLSLAVSVLLLRGSLFADRIFGQRFFEPGEPYLAAVAVFLLGNAAWGYRWVYYIVAVLAVGLAGSFVLNRVLKRDEPFSFFYVWLPLAIAGIITTQF